MREALLAGCAGAFSEWQQSLAARNNKALTDEARAEVEARQRTLLAAVADGPEALASHLRARLGLEAGAAIGAPPLPRTALTPAEFRDPPIGLERELAAAWEGLVEPRRAAQPLFWLLCHVEWIGQGRFDDIEAALTLGDGARTSDQRTRNFLRRTGGLPHVRYNVTAFSDCPLARAWWRVRLAAEAARASADAIGIEEAHKALHANRQVWEALVMVSVRNVTAINHPSARAALVATIAEHALTDTSGVRSVASALARHALTRSPEHVSWAELRAAAERVAASS